MVYNLAIDLVDPNAELKNERVDLRPDRVLWVLRAHRMHQHRLDKTGTPDTARRATRLPQEAVSNGQLGSPVTTAGRRSRLGPGQRYRVPKLSFKTTCLRWALLRNGSRAGHESGGLPGWRAYPVASAPRLRASSPTGYPLPYPLSCGGL